MGSSNEDAVLVRDFQDGVVDAFRQIVDRYQSLVCGVCFSITGQWALSEDIAQDTFVAAWSQRTRLEDPGRLRAWLCAIARNLSSKALRKKRREVPLGDSDVVDARTPLDEAIDKQDEQFVWSALEAMPVEYREPLVLFYQEGLDATEIADALDLKVPTVHQRLSRGRKQLKEGVSALVERTLSQNKPKRGFTAAVIAAIALSGSTPAQAAPSPTGGTSMFWKLTALTAGASLIAAGWFVTQPGDGEAGAAKDRAEVQAPAPAARAVAPGEAESTTKEIAQPARRAARKKSTRRAEYAWSGVVENWPRGALYAELKPCLDPIMDLPEELPAKLEIRLATQGTKVVGVRSFEGLPLRKQETFVRHCLGTALNRFGIDTNSANVPEDEGPKLTVTIKQPKPRPELDYGTIEQLGLHKGPQRGAKAAKVTMVVYTGFRCVFCGRLLGTLDQLLDEYPEDLAVVVRPMALFERDHRVTEASLIAEAQGRFWPLHDTLIAHQGELQDELLSDYAEMAGLDVEAFEKDLSSGKYRDKVKSDSEALKAAGVFAVPTVLLNGKRHVGALPIKMYREFIDAELGR